MSQTVAVSMQVGIESEDNANSGYFYPFDSPTVVYNLQYYSGGSSYSLWPLYAPSESYDDAGSLVTENYSPITPPGSGQQVPGGTFTHN